MSPTACRPSPSIARAVLAAFLLSLPGTREAWPQPTGRVAPVGSGIRVPPAGLTLGVLATPPTLSPALSPPALTPAPPAPRETHGRMGWRYIPDALAFARARYEPTGLGEAALSMLDKLGPDFSDLITDAGIVFRINDFRRFVLKNGLAAQGPQEARRAFARHLGKRVVYRALSLTEAEYQGILRDGMKAPGLASGRPDWESMTAGELRSLFLQKLLNIGSGSPLLSVSDYREVAISAASAFLYKRPKPLFGFHDPKVADKAIYLFKLEIPEVDLVYHDAYRPMVPEGPAGRTLVVTGPGKMRKEFVYDRTVESYALFEIPPQEISSSEKIAGRYSYAFKSGH